MNCVIGIVVISHVADAALQHLKRNVRYLLPQCFETFPGTFAQEVYGYVEGCTTPHLERKGVP